MANYRKSFNLRNGVQIDDDNFIVNANGLVGIGTSAPTEFLDIRGNAKVVGVMTATSVYAGVATVGFITATQGLSVSGVLTATTFSGSAAGLTGIYAIAVDGWHVTSSGVSTVANVGVGTTNPQGAFQVGTGVTIYSTGDAKYTGIITASSFIGNVVGNVNGNVIGNLTGNVNSSGVSTLTTLLVGSAITATSGIVSATTFVGNLTGNVTGSLAGNATGLSGTPNITVNTVTASKVIADVIEVPNTGITTISKLLHVGTGGTSFAALDSGRIGVGTATPTSDLQIRKLNETLAEVVSDSSTATISIGQSVGVGKSTGSLRFGSTNKTFDILNNDTGNINMYLHAGPSGVGTGRFAWLYGQNNSELASLTYDGKLGIGITNPTSNLHVVGTSTVTGNAAFLSNVTVTGNLSAGSFSLPQLITNTNIYNTTGITTFNRIEVTSDSSFSGNVIVSSAASVGLGTTQPIVSFDARNKNALFGGVGINTNVSQGGLTVIGGGTFSSGVGIGTTSTSAYLGVYGNVDIYPAQGAQAVSVNIYSGEILTNNNTTVGLGTTSARSALDFSDVGKGIGGGANAFMIVPRSSNSERAIFGTGVGGIGTSAGALIFNTTTNKFQGYTGTAWVDLH